MKRLAIIVAALGATLASAGLITAWATCNPPPPLPLGVPTGPGLTLTFDDEFNGTALDTTKWCPNGNLIYSCSASSSWPSNSQATGLYEPGQVSVSGGYLNLTAQPVSPSIYQNPRTFDHITGVVQTTGTSAGPILFQQSQGVFEARIWLPPVSSSDSRVAHWPAFWLNPWQDTWPTNEIDIAEFHTLPGCHLHAGSDGSTDASGQNPTDYNSPPGVAGTWSSGWHTYSVAWNMTGTPTLTFHYDGNLVCTITDQVSSVATQIEIGYDVSTIRTDTPLPSPDGPVTMQIDYVRVWQWN